MFRHFDMEKSKDISNEKTRSTFSSLLVDHFGWLHADLVLQEHLSKHQTGTERKSWRTSQFAVLTNWVITQNVIRDIILPTRVIAGHKGSK